MKKENIPETEAEKKRRLKGKRAGTPGGGFADIIEDEPDFDFPVRKPEPEGPGLPEKEGPEEPSEDEVEEAEEDPSTSSGSDDD